MVLVVAILLPWGCHLAMRGEHFSGELLTPPIRLLNAPVSKGVKLRSLVTSKEPLVTKLQTLTP
jgi:hypothetical protein